jgi:hypothetical protein
MSPAVARFNRFANCAGRVCEIPPGALSAAPATARFVATPDATATTAAAARGMISRRERGVSDPVGESDRMQNANPTNSAGKKVRNNRAYDTPRSGDQY